VVVEERRNRADLIEVFRLSVIECEKLLERVEDTKSSGHSLKLNKFRCKFDPRKFFFSERIVDRRNLLDEDTLSACSLNSFKNRLTS